MTPEKFLEHTTTMAANLRDMTRKAAFVGLPKEKVGGKVYGDGMTIFRVGAIHEFGYGVIPQRSFLRTPFATKRKEMNKAIAQQFTAVTNGTRKPLIGLGRIGAAATNIVKGAFTSKGYGQWRDITEETKQRKGSSQVLVDTAILKGSVSYVIR